VQISGKNITTRPGYIALASQLASVRPSAIVESEYVPTGIADPVCHKIVLKDAYDYTKSTKKDLEISPVLPIPYVPKLCSCMMNSVECVITSKTPQESIQSTKSKSCKDDESRCKGINYGFADGHYGAYSQCNLTEQLSWVVNQYYLSKKDPAVCTSVNGTIQKALPKESQDNDCGMLLRQAKADGSGTVTALPASATGVVTSKSSTSPTNWDSLKVATKAAIIVSVIIVGLLTFSVALWLSFPRRKNRRNSTEEDVFEKPELPDNQVSLNEDNVSGNDGGHQIEIDGTEKIEMMADTKGWELSAQENQVHELEAKHGWSELTSEELSSEESKEKT
jgi:hypothetical protein